MPAAPPGVPRRALAAVVATVAAVALLASFRTPDQGHARVAGLPSGALSTAAPTAPPTAQGGGEPPPQPPIPHATATAAPTSIAPPVTTAPPPTAAPTTAGTPRPPAAATAPPPTSRPTPPPPPTPRPRPTATPVAASGLHDGTWTGSVVPAGDGFRTFGDVQVQLVISGGRITDVRPLQMPTHARSGAISNYAGPQLRSEVLQAQSAQIDTVSGATYTSQAYAQSTQAALDQARA
jgi:uncharacterized protein with FMN-binding domain